MGGRLVKTARQSTMPRPESPFVGLSPTPHVEKDESARDRPKRIAGNLAVTAIGAPVDVGARDRARRMPRRATNRTRRTIDVALSFVVMLELIRNAPHAAPAIAGVVIVASSLPLLIRRRAPITVLCWTTAACAAGFVLGFRSTPLPYPALVALFTAASLVQPSRSLKAAAACTTLLIGSVAITQGVADDDWLIDWPISMAGAWILGYGVMVSRCRTELLERQADQITEDQAAATRLAIQQERAGIARELHDIVAHNVSVMVVQATAANRCACLDPEQARETLASLATIGRSALLEMRRLLDVLDTEDEPPDHWPLPRLEQIPMLVTHVRQAGLPVRLEVQGDVRPLPAGVELNAYRIVQEALTNTLKHAGRATAEVIISYHADALELYISDSGHGPQQPSVGRGLVGMRERVGLVGGVLDVGTGHDGGFVVAAVLPLREVP
jgi:signal transduction histidine kinase